MIEGQNKVSPFVPFSLSSCSNGKIDLQQLCNNAALLPKRKKNRLPSFSILAVEIFSHTLASTSLFCAWGFLNDGIQLSAFR